MQQHRDIGPVLVTGAGGFIGSHAVRGLMARRSVIAATRDGRNGTRRLDLLDAAAMPAALAGVGAVVHCAVGDRAVTVTGTRDLLAAAAQAGVRRFVHISSVAVYGAATGVVTEATPMRAGSGRGYGAWKAAAEEACLAQAGLDVVRLRPAIVYGAGSAPWVRTLAHRILSGRWGTFGAAGEGTCNLVHVRDVVSAVDHALTYGGIAGAAFNVDGEHPITWNDWFSRLAGALGVALRPVGGLELQARVLASLPLKAAIRLAPGLAPAVGAGWVRDVPARSELALFGLKATYPALAACTAMQWVPRVSLEEGLAECVAWINQL